MGELLKLLLSSPDEISEAAEQYKPALYAIINQAFGIFKDFVNNEEYYKYSALNDYNTYKAHIDAGFSEEQAFLLMIRNSETTDKMLKSLTTNNKKKD